MDFTSELTDIELNTRFYKRGVLHGSIATCLGVAVMTAIFMAILSMF